MKGLRQQQSSATAYLLSSILLSDVKVKTAETPFFLYFAIFSTVFLFTINTHVKKRHRYFIPRIV